MTLSRKVVVMARKLTRNARTALKRWLAGSESLTFPVLMNGLVITSVLFWNARETDLTFLSVLYLLFVGLGYYFLAFLIIISVLHLVCMPFRRLKVGVIVVVTSVLVFCFLVDGFVFQITRMHIDAFWLEWILNDFAAFGLSANTLRSALLALLFLLLVEVIVFRLGGRVRMPRWKALLVVPTILLMFGLSQAMHAIAYERNDASVTALTPYLPAYVPVTSHKRTMRLLDALQADETGKEDASADAQGLLRYPLREIASDAPPGTRLPNIIVIFNESWRTDAMSPEITPNVSRLAERSTVCTQHFCTGNSTIAGTFGFFYGLAPTYWPSVKADNARIDNPVLIDVLRQQGYTFGIFAKSNFKRHKIKDTVFRDIDVRETFAGETIDAQDADMTRQVIEFLRDPKTQERPFMALVFFKSNHAPYSYPPDDSIFMPAGDLNLMAAGPETDPTSYFNDYLNATHYVDRLTGSILATMDTLGLMSNSVIVITTDHGEEFNDNRTNCWGHASNFTRFQTHVPLVLYAPGKPARQIEFRTSHVDIVPTLLQEFLYCTNDPADYSNGINLFRASGVRRPLVIAGYVNHAFVIDDNVHEVFPFFAREYKLDNVEAMASPPPPEMIREIMLETTRFFDRPTSSTGPSAAGTP